MFGGTLCHSAVRFNRVTECLVILKAIHNYDRRMCNLLNITPTMDLQNIDTINTPNASQMLNTNNTVPHPTIQCLLYEVFFNTIYLDFTPKHLPHRQDHPLYPSSVLQRVIYTLFYVQSYVIFMHRARVNLKPLRMMNVNNDPSSVNTRITSLLENYLKPQNVLFVQATPTVMHTNAINTLNALNTHGITLRPSFSIPRAHSYLILRA
eukprot:355793_1